MSEARISYLLEIPPAVSFLNTLSSRRIATIRSSAGNRDDEEARERREIGKGWRDTHRERGENRKKRLDPELAPYYVGQDKAAKKTRSSQNSKQFIFFCI